MASATDASTSTAPNAQALLAVAIDRDGKQTPASDALQRLRGEGIRPLSTTVTDRKGANEVIDRATSRIDENAQVDTVSGL